MTLSLLGLNFGWVASRELRRPTFHKAIKTRDRCTKRTRPGSLHCRTLFGLSRVVSPASVEAAGIEPAYGSSQWQALQELTRTPDPVAAYLQLFGGTDSHSLSTIERDLSDVLLRWPQLPDHIRQVIMTLVRQS